MKVKRFVARLCMLWAAFLGLSILLLSNLPLPQAYAQQSGNGQTQTIQAIIDQAVAGTVQALSQPSVTAPPRTATPIITPTLNPAAFDFSTAKLYTSDGDMLEMQVPRGWQLTTNAEPPGSHSFLFATGSNGPQDAPIQLEIDFADEQTFYANFDPGGVANSPLTMLQVLINESALPQAGSPTYSFSAIHPVKIGTLDGQGLTASGSAAGQQPATRYDIRVAALPPNEVLLVAAQSTAMLWTKAQPVFNKMIDSLVIKPGNIPTPTAIPTLHPLLLTATALQTQLRGLTPTNTRTPTRTPVPTSTRVTAGIGTPITLPDRLQYVDMTLGTGDVALNGKTLDVEYVGKLADGTVFDTTQGQTPPYFEFLLGAGEVIKGWDQGLVGMKVGGERLLTIPPTLAYGTQGVPPKIPPNATLIFDVSLIAVR